MRRKPRIHLNAVNMWPSFTTAEFEASIRPVLGHFELMWTDHPDVLFHSVFDGRHGRGRTGPDSIRPRPGCRHIFFTGENVAPPLGHFDFHISHHRGIPNPSHFRMPNFLFWTRRFGHSLSELIKDPIAAARAVLRPKFCAYVASNPVVPWRTDPARRNARLRDGFVANLMAYRSVDCPGRCLNNMALLPRASDYNIKIPFLRKYRFSVTFENQSSSGSEGYVTEKLTDAMLAGCLPIYWGDCRVGEDFNEDSFLRAGNPAEFETLIATIAELDQDRDAYLEKIRQPWLHNNRLPHFMTDAYAIEVFSTVFSGKEQ